MKLNTLLKYKKKNKTIGRGIGSGHGKQSGRGTKGQKARSGKTIRADFEGGQTPLFQRLPKYRGFTPYKRLEYQIVNVAQLETLNEKEVTREVLASHGIVKKKDHPVKLLGDGEITKALSVTLDKASQSAIEKITKAGGNFTALSIHEPKKLKS